MPRSTRTSAILVLALVASAGPFVAVSRAQQPDSVAATPSDTLPPLFWRLTPRVPPVPDSRFAQIAPFNPARVPALNRPLVLPALYASFAVLQVLDARSTLGAVGAGGRELNPVLRTTASNAPLMYCVKAGVTVGTIYLSERLWKKNRTASIIMMVAINGAYAAIVSHNTQRPGM